MIERADGERFVFSDLGNRVYRWQAYERGIEWAKQWIDNNCRYGTAGRPVRKTGKADMDESWRERHERESTDFHYHEQQRRGSSPARGGLGIVILLRLVRRCGYRRPVRNAAGAFDSCRKSHDAFPLSWLRVCRVLRKVMDSKPIEQRTD